MRLFARFVRRARLWFKDAPPHSARATARLVREDWFNHRCEWSSAGFHAVATYRLGAWLPHAPRPVRAVLGPAYRVMYVWVRNVYGIELPATATVGRRFGIAHQSGIVIHYLARIGDDCTVRQNVTIGAPNNERLSNAPVLGNGVEVGAGAAIIGRVTIGDGARIGPNAVVMTNVPAGATVFAPRARMVQLTRRLTPVPDPRAANGVRAPSDVAVPLPGAGREPAGWTEAAVRDAS